MGLSHVSVPTWGAGGWFVLSHGRPAGPQHMSIHRGDGHGTCPDDKACGVCRAHISAPPLGAAGAGPSRQLPGTSWDQRLEG